LVNKVRKVITGLEGQSRKAYLEHNLLVYIN
jgi:hypothetical protein